MEKSKILPKNSWCVIKRIATSDYENWYTCHIVFTNKSHRPVASGYGTTHYRALQMALFDVQLIKSLTL